MIYRGFDIYQVSGGYMAKRDKDGVVVQLGDEHGSLLTEEHAMEAVDRFKRWEVKEAGL